MSVTLGCNRQPLLAGQRQDISFAITAEGHNSLFFIIPVGLDETALMKVEAFHTMKTPSLQGNRTKDVRIAKDLNTQGVLHITITSKSRRDFCVVLSGCEVNEGETKVIVRLEGGSPQVVLATCEVEKTRQRPQIQQFYASQYHALDQARVTLHWSIDPAGDYRLIRRGQENPLQEGKAGDDRAIVQISASTWDGEQRTRFKLEALAGAPGENSREVIIHGYNQSAVKSLQGPGNGIVGFYAYRGKLYALARSTTDNTCAGIWCTENGFDNWQPVTDGKQTPIIIPLQDAESPGVVFQDKLWLMGGSSCDPNRSTNAVYYYDFRCNTFIDDVAAQHGDLTLWPESMGARMGHALVASPDGQQLWVMGGYDQSGGTKNDVWVFDGTTWKSLGYAPWAPRCMFGATTTADSIWVGGGFQTTPGGKTHDDLWKWDAQRGWSQIKLSLNRGATPEPFVQQYCACALQFLGDVYAFTTYFDPAQKEFKNQISRLQFGNNDWSIDTIQGVVPDWTLSRDYYSLQTVAYNGCMFIRNLARHTTDNNVHYFVRVTAQR